MLNRINSRGSNSGRLKRRSGSIIAEFPPAFIIIFFFFFIPALNIVYLGLALGAGWFLNNIELRSVSYRIPTTLGLPSTPTSTYTLVTSLPESANWNGLMGVIEDTSNSPQVAQYPLPNNANAVGTSSVKTKVTIKPLLPIPFLPFPGLGKSFELTYVGTIQQEEQGP